MHGFEIKCGECGEKSPAGDWIERPSGFSLPVDCFQCPKCNMAIKKVATLLARPPGDDVPSWFKSVSLKLERIQPWL